MNRYPAWLSRSAFENQQFTRFNERPIEFAFVFRKFSELYPKRVLDVGTGDTALPALLRNCGSLITAIDNVRDYWPRGMFNRHWHVVDDDIRSPRTQGPFDMVVCVSVIEHIVESTAAVQAMLGLLRPGGDLLITCPYTESTYHRNVYELEGSSYGQTVAYATQSLSRSEVTTWLEGTDASIVEQEFWRCWSGAFWTAGEQRIPPERSSVDAEHQLTCLHIRAGEDASRGEGD